MQDGGWRLVPLRDGLAAKLSNCDEQFMHFTCDVCIMTLHASDGSHRASGHWSEVMLIFCA
jgi:hypothetical protein